MKRPDRNLYVVYVRDAGAEPVHLLGVGRVLANVSNILGSQSRGNEFDASLLRQFAERQVFGTLAGALVAFTITAVIWNHVPSKFLIPWVAAQAVIALLSLPRWKRFQHIEDDTPKARAFIAEAVVWKAATGTLWGLLAILSHTYLVQSEEFFTVIAVAAVTVGSISTLAAIPAAVYAFILLSFTPLIATWLFGGDTAHITLGLLSILLLGVILASANIAHGQILSVMQAEFGHRQLSDEYNAARGEWLELSDAAEAYAVFDNQNRLLAWNERFVELMQIPGDLLRKGTPRTDVIRNARQTVDVASGAMPIEIWLSQRTQPTDADTANPDSGAASIREYEGGLWLQRRVRRTRNGNIVVSFAEWTDLVNMESALGESEERYRLIAENSPDAILVRVEDEIVFANPAAVKMFRAQSEADLLGLSVNSLTHPDDHVTVLANRAKMADGSNEALPLIRVRMRRLDGTYVMTAGSGAHHTWQGRPAVLVTRRDITAQIEAEERLRESEDRYRRIAELSPNAILIRVEDRIVYANPAAVEMFGADSEADLLYETMMSFVHPDDAHLVLNNRSKMKDGVHDRAPIIQVRRRRLDGSYFYTEGSGAPFVWQGQPAVMVMLRDVTMEAEADRLLRESEERLRSIVDNMPGSIVLKDLDLRIRMAAGRDFKQWSGINDADAVGKTADDMVPEDLAAELEQRDREILETGEVVDIEVNTVTADGQTRTFMSTRFPIKDGSATTIGVGIINQEVTDQRKTEAQLRQAQKMEVVGQLTGGIAHDFNNLLTVILGNAELLSEYVQDEPEAGQLLANALKGAQRGADLTQRLLAFSRRQTLNPEPVDIKARMAEMVPLLRHTLPATISMQTQIAEDLPLVQIDPTQLESAIMNLAINARDAISNGGEIELAARIVNSRKIPGLPRTHRKADEYVLVTVTDTGAGMTENVRDHAFEPFFTTKPVGAGSGLGLSMVYGFVTQSGGHIAIDSVQGEGTCVKLYLPIAERGAVAQPEAQAEAIQIDGGKETILVVEDDADVRALVVGSLTKLGYQVVSATDGLEALKAMAGTETIDVLLTDVVLPNGMLGPDIARELATHHPHAQVLLMSGYTRGAETGMGELDESYELIQKPFTRAQLGGRLRQIINASRQTPPMAAQA